MALILIAIIAFIPPLKNDSAKVLRIVAVPFLIITPLATTIIFNFYYWTYEFLSKALILNTIINFSPVNLMIFDNNGPLLLSENLKKQSIFPLNFEKSTLLMGPDNAWLNTTKQQAIEIATVDGRCLAADFSSFQMPNRKYACVAILNDVTYRF